MPALLRKKPFTHLFRGGFVLCVVVISYLAFTPLEHAVNAAFSDKINHFLAFFVLSGLLDYSFPRSRFIWQKFLPLILYGVAIECIQYFIPHREFSLFDVLADLVGIFLYPLAMLPFVKTPSSPISP